MEEYPGNRSTVYPQQNSVPEVFLCKNYCIIVSLINNACGKHNTREKQNEYHFAGNMNHMMDLGERIALGGL